MCIRDSTDVLFQPPAADEPRFGHLVAHAATLDSAALTSLVEVAVSEAQDRAGWVESEEDVQLGYDFVGNLLLAWARRVRFSAVPDLDALIEMIAAQPGWVKKRIAHEALLWIDDLISDSQPHAAQRLCRALRQGVPNFQ